MIDRRDPIERLLELAGPRQAPASDPHDRARQVAHAAWRDEVRRVRRLRAIGAAAVSLAAAAVLVMAVTTRRSAVTPTAPAPDVVVATHQGAPLRPGSMLQTDAATRTALRLTSGIEIRLDVDSAITFTDPSTIALARGALFVDTGAATGAHRSLDVRTPLGTARDIGTRFEVRLVTDRQARAMRVRVRDGVVRVTTASGAQSAERGFELLATENGGITRAKTPLSGDEWNWITLAAAPFDLDGKTLADFLAWVAREGGWQIRFGSDALAASASTIVLNGSVDGLTPDQALRAVLATCGLAHRRQGDVVTIEAARS